MKEPVLILSDLHLGHKASRIRELSQLEPLLENCRTLLINGDAWQELSKDFHDDGARLLADLRSLCAARDIDLVLLPGNHDPSSGERGFVSLGNGEVVVTHGDCVYPEGAPWSRMVGPNRNAIDELWKNAKIRNIDDRISLGKAIAHVLVPPWYAKSRNISLRIWDAATPPTRAIRMLVCWWSMVRETRRFSREFFPHAKILICGHFHRSGIWDDGELLLINTGSYMPPGGALWCEWHGRTLRVGKVLADGDTMRRGEISGVWSVGV